MKLGFHYHLPGVYNNGVIFVPGVLGVFLSGIAKEVDELVLFLHSPLKNEVNLLDYPIEDHNVRLVDIGLHDKMPKRLLLKRKIIVNVTDEMSDLDLLLLRAPSPLTPFFVKYKPSKLKTSILLVGNYMTSSDDPSLPFWKNKLIRLFSYYIHLHQNKAVQCSQLFVNSQLLLEENLKLNPSIVLVKTTTLTKADFYERSVGEFSNAPTKLIYTGRIDLSKGLFYVLKAIAKLKYLGYNVEFHLVGGENFGANSVREEIVRYSVKLGINDLVFFHGFKKVGKDLGKMYKMADVFINASIGNEGFPRTIWEAMAHSLPVIATRVGGIPYFLKDGIHAILIEPKDVDGIVDAIQRVCIDRELRVNMIREGLQLARENTIDTQSRILVDHLKLYCDG